MSEWRDAFAMQRLIGELIINAVDNVEPMTTNPESETVEFFSHYDLVYAMWVVGPALGDVRFMKLKGPEKLAVNLMFNAIPVKDEAEALRWAGLLSTSRPLLN